MNPAHSNITDSPSELQQLRAVLLGSDYETLLDFKTCLSDPTRYQEHLSLAISEAIALRSQADDSVAQSLAPTVERSLTESVKKNPAPIAEALYPIMGPAIRRSITETMNQVLDNFNQALEQSLSLRSLMWRIDAWRTGRTYAEIAMLNTLDYQVEQLFLIHGETSVLLHHLMVDSTYAKDANMVSSMLSAIQDFVSDSFSVSENEALDTLRLGDLSVCIVSGPHAVLAAVVRGRLPELLRTRMHEALETVHQSQWEFLHDFSGDTHPFLATEPTLQTCLLSQAQEDHDEQDKKKPWLAIVACLIFTTLLGYWAWTNHQTQTLWSNAVQDAENEPGFVIISYGYKNDNYYIRGLKDPKARPPVQFISTDTQQKLNIQWKLQPYYSADVNIVDQRVGTLLNLPTSISYKLDGTTLQLAGTTTSAEIDKIKPIALSVAGIDQVDTRNIIVNEPTVAAALPIEPNIKLASLSQQIEATELFFDLGSIVPDIESMEKLPSLLNALQRLTYLATDNQLELIVQVIGYSDQSGPEKLNLRISQSRAKSVVRLLKQKSIVSLRLQSTGLGSILASDGFTHANRRLVRLHVTLQPTREMSK